MFDGHPQRRFEQPGGGGQVVLDDAPVDGGVHGVEQVEVGEPDRVFADLVGVLAGAGFEVGLPPQPVDVGGALQLLQEVVADAGGHQGVAVDVDPERLGLDQAALAAVDADPYFAPPGGGCRAPTAQPQRVLEFEGPDQVDHGAAHDPQWVRFVEAQFVHVVLADVLDVARGGVQPQPAAGVDVGHPQWPLPVEDVGMAVEDRHQCLIQGHRVRGLLWSGPLFDITVGAALTASRAPRGARLYARLARPTGTHPILRGRFSRVVDHARWSA